MSDYDPDGLPYFDPDHIIDSEVIEHTKPTNERSIARQVILQVLYEVDSARHNVTQVIQEQLTYHQLSSLAGDMVRRLCVGVIDNHEILDEVLQEFAPEWPMEQIAIIDRNILRLAVYEFTIYGRTPMRVAINEAVELAKVYGADGSARFVNGVLGSLSDNQETVMKKLHAGKSAPDDEMQDIDQES